jgi:hypothetical protein
MTLKQWVAQNRDEILEKQTSSQEIESVLSLVDRDLRDAGAIESIDGRFTCTYWACLQIARAALRASGYRLRSTAHQVRAIESMKYTLGLDAVRLRRLQIFRTKRAAAAYETAGLITDEELRDAREMADYLKSALYEWLKSRHPDLLR